jgi:hypothetical protein
MIKRSLVALAMVALLLPASFAQGLGARADRGTARASAPNFALKVGERLSYAVSWSNYIVAGELTLETKSRSLLDGVEAVHVSAEAQSVGLVRALVYKVNDTYVSFINPATMRPLRAEKHSRRGNKREQSSIVIDHKNRTAQTSDGRTIEIPADTYDMAGLLYAIRAMDLEIGRPRTFNLLENNKLYAITVTAEAKEKVTTRLGSFDAIRMATKMAGGRDSDLYNLKLYVTNDARRLPVLITAEPSWGDVKVELTAADGIEKK